MTEIRERVARAIREQCTPDSDPYQLADAAIAAVLQDLEALYDDGTSIDGLIHRNELRAALTGDSQNG